MSAITISRLTKRYGPVVAVDDLSFDVHPGKVTGFLGPNGSGKTTTLRILLGLAAPTSGTATIGGLPYRKLPDPARQVGAALDGNIFHPGRTAAQHLRVTATAAGIPADRVAEVLGVVGLADAAGRRVGGYSLGMRQRLSLAGALLGDPGTLVLDEPLNGLDPEGIRWMRAMLRALAAEGRAVLVSSHLLNEVAQTVDDIVVLARGRLVTQGALADLADRSPVIRARTTDPARLVDVLLAAGLRARIADGSTVEASPATADEVGLAAAAAGLPILELSRHDEDLESLFFDLTDKPQEALS
jgi:ABC-2 type transport system ATP-binding protein